jgi:hypothetical protein
VYSNQVLDRWPPFFHYRRAMRPLGRALCLLLAVVLVSASLPPGFDEDRSAASFCSPDCLLQQDAAAHSVAIATRTHEGGSVESTREPSSPVSALAGLVHVGAPDTPRAPPRS